MELSIHTVSVHLQVYVIRVWSNKELEVNTFPRILTFTATQTHKHAPYMFTQTKCSHLLAQQADREQDHKVNIILPLDAFISQEHRI